MRSTCFRVRLAACATAIASLLLAGSSLARPRGRSAASVQTVRLTLLSTTDIHGHLEPFSDVEDRPANRGLAKIATLVRQIRSERRHVLLFDCGDLIEGSAEAYYFARQDTTKPNPVIAAMNALDYDAVALGNHEFNFGLNVLWKAHRQANFPWLGANLRESYTRGPGYFPPYVIKRVAGVRVAIVGFVTPAVPHWEIPAHYRGYQFESIVDTARRIVPQLRRKADLVVAIVHSGLDRDPKTGREYKVIYPDENVAWELAEQVPQIDVLFYGHTHLQMPELFVHGVLMAQAKNWGESLAEADVTMQRNPSGHWQVADKHSHLIPVTGAVPPDPSIERIDAPYHAEVERYLGTVIAKITQPLSGAAGRVDDNALVDLIHRVQLADGKADVSLATMFMPSTRWEAGPVTIREVFALYPYENWLYTVEMNGAQLREALEQAARFFPAWPAENGELRLPSYNADSAAGVSYRVDLTRPVGDRIVDLRFRGRTLDPSQKLRVAVNNYRYAGGGGYRVLLGLPVVYRSSHEERTMIINYLRSGHPVPAKADGNWKVAPAEARQMLLREAESGRTPASFSEGSPGRRWRVRRASGGEFKTGRRAAGSH
ncbi:MAG: bifunctional metallophosphatase/5'-nucleotidase [Acidobacteriota bacterium]|nr:bifunctional metallophosphatase/5'-nucleotidase [Acidobacteriota bacterium]